MKTYRELFFKGTTAQLSSFILEIPNYATEYWSINDHETSGTRYLSFNYTGKKAPHSFVSICIDKQYMLRGTIKVGNIIPTDVNELSLDEYNNILVIFYNEIIKPYKEHGTELIIEGPTDDIFDPRSIISDQALSKLRSFCFNANKSTGSSHPCDQKRWYDFICQTVDDNKMFDYDTLAKFLQDEAYWGKKDSTFIGVIGSFAWSEEKAYELASEYDAACSILSYYKKEKGI